MDSTIDKRCRLKFYLNDKNWLYSFNLETGEYSLHLFNLAEYLNEFLPDCTESWYYHNIKEWTKYRRRENIIMLVGYFEKFVVGVFFGEKFKKVGIRFHDTPEYAWYRKEQTKRVEDICKAFRVDRKRPLRPEEIDELIVKWALRELEK